MSSERAAPAGPYVRCGPPRFSATDSVDNLRRVVEGLQQELVACQRLAALGTMTSMVMHEFNNLLTPILARAEAALVGNDIAFMRKSLERALAQAQRAMAVSQHLLSFVHEPAEPDKATSASALCCNVSDSVREALETMTRPLEKDGIELRLSVPADLHIAARRDLFCQVMLNLLLNARRAMQGKPGVLAVAAVANAQHAVIDVRDTGCGIPRELVETLFNPFLAADPLARPNDWQQVGLGLSICRLVAHQHSATLRVALNAGERGCTFRLHWPLAAAGTC